MRRVTCRRIREAVGALYLLGKTREGRHAALNSNHGTDHIGTKIFRPRSAASDRSAAHHRVDRQTKPFVAVKDLVAGVARDS
jgi:hypothetical protein